MKQVNILAHSFDMLPAHAIVTARGMGSNLRIAAMRAIANLVKDRQIKGRRLHSCKITLVVTDYQELRPRGAE